MKLSSTIILFLFSLTVFCQDKSILKTNPNYSSMIPWEYFMIYSPEYFGPNALPVPQVKNGILPSETQLELGIARHFGKGDQTQNIFSKLFIALPKYAGLSIYFVPVEYYTMNKEVKNYRRARDNDGKGFVVGDVYVGTHIQILEGHKFLPDLLLTTNIKTASGGKLWAARYTDTPGYFFDLSFGKDIFSYKKSASKIRIYGMVGFYAWQIYHQLYRQDDAYIFGGGITFESIDFLIDNQIGGYYGYINNGDRPLVYRLSFSTKNQNTFRYKLTFQQGINNFPYTSILIFTLIDLKKLYQTKLNKKG